jgi:hypothetical protein
MRMIKVSRKSAKVAHKLGEWFHRRKRREAGGAIGQSQ